MSSVQQQDHIRMGRVECVSRNNRNFGVCVQVNQWGASRLVIGKVFETDGQLKMSDNKIKLDFDEIKDISK